MNNLKKTAQNYSLSKRLSKTTGEGFTLVELLVVIAIVAILAAVVVLIINPLELTKRARDIARIADLISLHQAIGVAVQEASTGGSNILCNGSALPCTGSSGATGAATRKNDGTGWVKVNLSSAKALSVSTLPIDQINNGVYVYTYQTNANVASPAWEIDAVLESAQQSPKMTTDGGNNDTAYEVGSDLTIIP